MNKQLDYDLNTIEEVMRDADIDLPVAWAILFLNDGYEILKEKLFGTVLETELDAIVDWIRNGNPEMETDEDYGGHA